MRKVVGSMMLVAVMGAALMGCEHRGVVFAPIGVVTVRVAPDQDADVVWLLREETGGSHVFQTVLRCHNTEPGPVCVTAKESGQ
jgi:hypothetical protein